MAQVVLITGCSTGIGRDLVQRLFQAGYSVVATARKVETLDDLPATLKLPLDVTQDESICRAVEHTFQQLGRIDVLVNNAGYALQGALEEIPLEPVQQMFEVNVFGVLRMIRAVVPLMRQQHAGRIINIGSVAGKLALPVNGTYSASKFALEALNDALRLELLPFGIQVVLIEPGAIKTHFDATVQAHAQAILSNPTLRLLQAIQRHEQQAHAQAILSNPTSPYRALYERARQVTSNMRQGEPGPEVVSQAVQQAIEAGRPKARYLPGAPVLSRLAFYLGDPVKDFIFKRLYQIVPVAK